MNNICMNLFSFLPVGLVIQKCDCWPKNTFVRDLLDIAKFSSMNVTPFCIPSSELERTISLAWTKRVPQSLVIHQSKREIWNLSVFLICIFKKYTSIFKINFYRVFSLGVFFLIRLLTFLNLFLKTPCIPGILILHL